jgi:hypothetical protein
MSQRLKDTEGIQGLREIIYLQNLQLEYPTAILQICDIKIPLNYRHELFLTYICK